MATVAQRVHRRGDDLGMRQQIVVHHGFGARALAARRRHEPFDAGETSRADQPRDEREG